MELAKFQAALKNRQGRYDAIDVGGLITMLLLETCSLTGSEHRRSVVLSYLDTLDRHLADANAPDDLRTVVAGAHDAVADWIEPARSVF